MSPHFIPQDQAGALDWMRSFASGISGNPAVYELSPGEAATIAQAVDAFAAAYAVALDPATGTKVTRQIKDEARNSAEDLCRRFARIIKSNNGVSDAAKIAIGVRPINNGRSKIHVPRSSPLLTIIGATPKCHTLCYTDTNTPSSRAKPFGAIQLQLFVALGDASIRNPDLARYRGGFTRNPIGVSFESSEEGKIATYFARWVSRRGDVGPWSLPVSMRVAG
jgi:hypothetical protein